MSAIPTCEINEDDDRNDEDDDTSDSDQNEKPETRRIRFGTK